MFWNKKEDKNKLPDLPPLSASLRNNPKLHAGPDTFNLEEFPGDQSRSLPSFPDSPTENGFSQSAIKNAITDEETEDSEEDHIPNLPEEDLKESKKDLKEIKSDINKKFQTVELDNSLPSTISLIPSLSSQTQNKPNKNLLEKNFQEHRPLPSIKPTLEDRKVINSDIFVKIEKFRAARRSLNDVKDKLEEVGNLLKRIREIRLREEQELSSWEKEITNAKAQVENVNSTIFEKVD